MSFKRAEDCNLNCFHLLQSIFTIFTVFPFCSPKLWRYHLCYDSGLIWELLHFQDGRWLVQNLLITGRDKVLASHLAAHYLERSDNQIFHWLQDSRLSTRPFVQLVHDAVQEIASAKG